MKKKIKNDHILKKRKLLIEMKRFGLNRVSKDSLIVLAKYDLEELRNIFKSLKEELIVNGKKTLEKKDVERVLKEENKGEFEI